MAILGSLLKKGIILRESLEQQYSSAEELQKTELRKLLITCKNTEIGITYNFEGLLASFKRPGKKYYEQYKSKVPIFDYNKIYNQFWHKTREGKKNITWPGKIKYYALSSGTTGTSSKYIPVTKEMLKSIRKTSVRQMLLLGKLDLPNDIYTKGILMLGGSTDLRKSGHYFEGDLSGITTSQIPFWFQHFYKPGKKISKTPWDHKLDEITARAKDWDISIIAGVPAWLQLLMEKIISYYQVKNIHEIWPNLTVYVHGGVAFEPYKNSFNRLLGKPLIYLETYLASEGFVAFQAHPDRKAMRLVMNNGIFYEFIPFTTDNFDEEGELKEGAETLCINEIEENKEYAILLSTNAGAWRYLIGDVVKFVSKEESEIIITGRTKLFLSLCGEHLSLDNINQAIQLTEQKMKVALSEFTVIGEPDGSTFMHSWFIGSDDSFDEDLFLDTLDAYLKELNDDYAVERKHALGKVTLKKVPSAIFLDWMKSEGKFGAQQKFPRVLKREKAESWKSFVNQKLV